MTVRRNLTTVTLLAIAFLVAGCSSAPDAELTEAVATLDDARETAQADQWAPEEFAEARQALDEARQEIETQNGRFALMRDYDKALQDIARANAAAAEARRAATTQKENARQEAGIKLQEATAAIDIAREALDKAPVTKDTRVDIQLYNADLEGLGQSLDEVQGLITGEDYRGATVRAEAITQSANDIAQKMNEARERLEQRRR